jgi:transcriptional regulator with XRE-family HTH domain
MAKKSLTFGVYHCNDEGMVSNGEALRMWRLKKELSQEEAADQMDPPVLQGTWANWEADRQPDLHNALQLETLTRGQVKAANWPRRRSTTANRVKRRSKKVRALPPTGT